MPFISFLCILNIGKDELKKRLMWQDRSDDKGAVAEHNFYQAFLDLSRKL